MRKYLFGTKFSKNSFDLAMLVLRIGFGLLMIPAHGWPKLKNFDTVNENFISFMGLSSQISLGLTVFAEFFCSILIIFGFFTRWAVIPLIIAMLVALDQYNWEIFGNNELAFAFLLGYLTILLLGAGRYSMDKLISGK